MLRCIKFRKEAGCRFDHLCTGTLGIVGWRAGLSLGVGMRLTRRESEEFCADERTILLTEAFGQLLHYGIVARLAFAVGRVGATRFQTSEEEEATGGTARLAHTTDAATKGGCHTEGLFVGEAIEGGEGGHDTLRTIIAALEEFNGAGNTFFHVLHLDIQIIWVIFAEEEYLTPFIYMVMNFRNYLSAAVLAVLLTSCGGTFDERLDAEAREYTEKHLPALVEPGHMLDSITYEADQRTLHEWHTFLGQLDTPEAESVMKENETMMRQTVLENLRQDTKWQTCKEEGIRFAYHYRSTRTGNTVMVIVLEPSDYR